MAAIPEAGVSRSCVGGALRGARAVSSPGWRIFLSGVPGGKVDDGWDGSSPGFEAGAAATGDPEAGAADASEPARTATDRVISRAPQPGHRMTPPGSGSTLISTRQRGHCIDQALRLPPGRRAEPAV